MVVPYVWVPLVVVEYVFVVPSVVPSVVVPFVVVESDAVPVVPVVSEVDDDVDAALFEPLAVVIAAVAEKSLGIKERT